MKTTVTPRPVHQSVNLANYYSWRCRAAIDRGDAYVASWYARDILRLRIRAIKQVRREMKWKLSD